MAKRRVVAPWGIRIVSTGKSRAIDLLAHPQNWRKHGRAQVRAMDEVLETIGFVQSVVVNKRTSAGWKPGERGVETVIDGHLRVLRSLARGEDTEVPVCYVDLSPDEEKLVLATLDPIGAMAGRDDELLAGLVEDITGLFEGVDLDAILNKDKRKVQFEAGAACNVLVICGDSDTQDAVIRKLTAEGLTCKPTARS